MFSFVIPTKDRPESLKRALESIERQHEDCIEEVIIANNGGRISTEIVNICPNTKIIKVKGGWAAGSRNAGIRVAKGRYIIFIDDDCELCDGFIKNAKLLVGRNPILEPEFLNPSPGNCYMDAWFMFYKAYLASCKKVKDGKEVEILGNCYIIRMDILRKTGFFDESMRALEDKDYALMLKIKSHKIISSGKLKIRHYSRISAFSVFGQFFNYGIGDYQFSLKWGNKADILGKSKVTDEGIISYAKKHHVNGIKKALIVRHTGWKVGIIYMNIRHSNLRNILNESANLIKHPFKIAMMGAIN
jgi:glycosyltransferase involved in cell wall biosynthesis